MAAGAATGAAGAATGAAGAAAAAAALLLPRLAVGPYFAIFFPKFRPFFEEKKIREI